MTKIGTLDDLFYNLPFELQNKILYKSSLCSKESSLIKNYFKGLYIPFESIMTFGGVSSQEETSLIEHLTNIGELKHTDFLDDGEEEIWLMLAIVDYLEA